MAERRLRIDPEFFFFTVDAVYENPDLNHRKKRFKRQEKRKYIIGEAIFRPNEIDKIVGRTDKEYTKYLLRVKAYENKIKQIQKRLFS